MLIGPAADPAASGGGGSRERFERSDKKNWGTFSQFGSFWDIFSQIHTSHWALMSVAHSALYFDAFATEWIIARSSNH